ncbi:MAG: 4-hydroxythreonine-4-phosphate dehydrogenase PdxA [Pyrinomonadaceae bacterium]
MGDPSGIGPEVVLKAVAEPEVLEICTPIIIGDAQSLAESGRTLYLQGGYDVVRRGEQLPASADAAIIYDLDNIHAHLEMGVESGVAGKAAAEYIETAVELCAIGELDAIATAPINKRALFLGGYGFPGHTEFLAHLTQVKEYAMAFVAANLRIVLLSTHVPLVEALKLVQRERLVRLIKLADKELRRWGVEDPRMAVAALNPHGGEGGLFRHRGSCGDAAGD